MKLVRSLLIAGIGTVVTVSPLMATDFYVQATNPGPVSGAPLGAVALRADENSRPRNLLLFQPGTIASQPKVKTAETKATSVKPKPKPKPAVVRPRTATTTNVGLDREASRAQRLRTMLGGASDAGKWVRPRKKKPVVTESESEAEPTETSSSQNTGNTGGTTTGNTGGTNTGNTGGTTTGNTGGTTTGGTTTPTQPAPPPAPPTPPTQGQTWKNLAALLQSGQVKAGDRIYLMEGYHGSLNINGAKFSSPVLVTNVPGQVAHVDSLIIYNSSNLAFNGLKVWPTSGNAGPGPLVATYADTNDISITNFDVRAVADSGNYMQWSQSTWLKNQRWGIQVDGNRMTVSKNRVTGIGHGIHSLGDNALVEENIVDGFSGDAFRGLGDNTIVRRNKAQNCFQVDGNHMDAFQSFTVGSNGVPGAGTQRNLTIEDNKFFEWTSSTTNPLRCQLDGVGMFDGMFDGLVIRNNVITSTAYHGISVSGAINAQIVNNTVTHPDGVAGKLPWIQITTHKNGTPSRNVTIANNLAMNILTQSDPSKNVNVTNNMILTNASAEFTSIANRDFTLKPGAKAADAGLAQYAPKTDIQGTARPKGNGPDLGAYESR
ncbi:MAG: right-handed parallel beta-helix repeat-containing protein [Paracoccaceae bacterium]